MPMRDTTTSDAATLALEGVTHEVDGRCLLDVPKLHLTAGRKTVVMGPNGAGKSLLLRVMHGLLVPTQGRVLIDGHELTSDDKRRQAFVHQTPVLLRRTAKANLEFVLRARKLAITDCADLFEQVGLVGKEKTPARLLSGGEKQRLAIAMALAIRPKTLFLDEPTASLDPASVAAIEDIINRVSQTGVQIVLVTHDIRQARRLADEVVLMSHGRVVECDLSEAFFAGPRTDEARAYLEGRIPT